MSRARGGKGAPLLAALLATTPALAQSPPLDRAGLRSEPAAPVLAPSPPNPPVDPRRVADYTLSATLDTARHVVRARGTLVWRNPSVTPTRELWFHLYLNAFSGNDTLFMRTQRGGPWEDERRDRHWGRITVQRMRLQGDNVDLPVRLPPGDPTELRVPLPREVAPGEAITVAMEWESHLPELIARTGFHQGFHMVAQWFPKVAVRERDGRWASFPFHAHSEFYADFGRYDVTLTVPRGYTVGATGVRVSGPERVPEGERSRYVIEPVHDFAWTAWDHFRTRDARVGDKSLRVLFAPGDERDAERVVEVMRGTFGAYARRYGPYPYPVLTVLLPPRGGEEAGGMEYPTFITTVGQWWLPRRARELEYVTIHEFGHQYFYGLFASNEHDHPFLDEGFCEYSTAAVMEDLYGHGGPMLDLPLLGPRIDVWATEAHSSGEIRRPVPVATGSADFSSYRRYGSHVYPRTATILRTAEGLYGRVRFLHAMRAYADEARFTHPTPETFFSVMERTLGRESVETFFRPALTQPFTVDYAVSRAESHRSSDGRWRGRVIVEREGPLALPVDIELEASDGQRHRQWWDARGTSVVIPYEGSEPLRAARVDPDGRIAIDRDRLNNARHAAGRDGDGVGGTNLPLMARVAYWVALVFSAVGP